MKRRILVTVLVLCITFSNIVYGETFSSKVKAEKMDINNESIVVDLNDLDNYPELKEYLEQSGLLETIIDSAKSNYSDIIEREHILIRSQNAVIQELSPIESEGFINKPTDYEVDQMMKKYGIENELTEDQVKVDIVFPKNYESQSMLSNESMMSSGSLYWVTYFTTAASFSIRIDNLGSPLDYAEGTVKKQYLNRTSWADTALTKTFSKSNITSGSLYTFYNTKYYMKENFEYDFIVVGGLVVREFSNAGEHDEIRYNSEAAPYSSMAALGGDRHHFVSKNALGAYGFNTNSAPCIRMVVVDHRETPSYGNSTFQIAEKNFLANEQYENLLQYEVDSFRSIPDPEGEYPSLLSKYTDSIAEVLYLYEVYFGVQ